MKYRDTSGTAPSDLLGTQCCAAFICSTPYQVIVALSIVVDLPTNSVADLYLLNHFRGSERVARNLVTDGAFRNVTDVDGSSFIEDLRNYRISRRIRKARFYLGYRGMVRRYFNLDGRIYDHVYLSVPDVLPQLALTRIRE